MATTTRFVDPAYEREVEVNGAFNSTDATIDVTVPLSRITRLPVCVAVGAIAGDEKIEADIALTAADGSYAVPSTGIITLKRTGASKTSGLKFSALFHGIG